MKETELRIGNYVELYGSLTQIHRVDFAECKCSHGIAVDKGNPIPLTEEWLLKFGFVIETGTKNIYTKYGLQFKMWEHNTISFIDSRKDYIQIDYVHTLQNLYFALTGEELTVTS